MCKRLKRVNVAFDWFEVFVFNTNLEFLYKIDIEGSKMFQQKKLPPVGTELTTPTIKVLEGRCLNHSATQSTVE